MGDRGAGLVDTYLRYDEIHNIEMVGAMHFQSVWHLMVTDELRYTMNITTPLFINNSVSTEVVYHTFQSNPA